MGVNDQIRLGVVGACRRGKSFKKSVDLLDTVRVTAVCDLNESQLGEAATVFGAEQQYTSYERMLDEGKLDAVLISTPMHLHAPQSIAALERGIHVMCEVTAAVSVEQCQQLVQACKKSKAQYMLAENYPYRRENQMIREMVRKGLFGQLYYAEGEYIHELKWEGSYTPWRRKWLFGINGITYGTHSLGPVLHWMNDDSVVRVCCAGTGSHYKDEKGVAYEADDTCTMLCQMRSGGLVKIRVDMLSDRPHSMRNYQLQGTDGCYESSRTEGGKHLVWLRSRCEKEQWLNLHDLVEEFDSPMWRKYGEAALSCGHGGADAMETIEFIHAIADGKPVPNGIHEAMDMTLPGLVSQQSVAQGGQWLEVDDSRMW